MDTLFSRAVLVLPQQHTAVSHHTKTRYSAGQCWSSHSNTQLSVITQRHVIQQGSAGPPTATHSCQSSHKDTLFNRAELVLPQQHTAVSHHTKTRYSAGLSWSSHSNTQLSVITQRHVIQQGSAGPPTATHSCQSSHKDTLFSRAVLVLPQQHTAVSHHTKTRYSAGQCWSSHSNTQLSVITQRHVIQQGSAGPPTATHSCQSSHKDTLFNRAELVLPQHTDMSVITQTWTAYFGLSVLLRTKVGHTQTKFTYTGQMNGQFSSPTQLIHTETKFATYTGHASFFLFKLCPHK